MEYYYTSIKDSVRVRMHIRKGFTSLSTSPFLSLFLPSLPFLVSGEGSGLSLEAAFSVKVKGGQAQIGKVNLVDEAVGSYWTCPGLASRQVHPD